MAKSRTAKGIPNRENFGDLTQLTPQQLATLLIQKHDALRAGPHYDVRLGGPDQGLFSWAARKGLPAPGGKHLAIRQPLHSWKYRKFEGKIPRGQYGAGKVKKDRQEPVLLTYVSPTAVSFTTGGTQNPERFVLKQMTGRRDWLLLNTTPTKAPPYDKPRYKMILAGQVEAAIKKMQAGGSVQEKIDGAHTVFQLMKDGIEATSYRTSAKTGLPITHTERIWGGRPKLDIPKDLQGSVLRGETYGVRDGKAIPPQELGGILNATLANALQKKKDQGVELRGSLFDIQQLGKKPIDPVTPYPERRKMLEDILRRIPAAGLHLPEEARTPEEGLQLWRDIVGGKNPRTSEGVVLRPRIGSATKGKAHEEHDVHIRDIFPGQGRLAGSGAGGFTYSASPEGPVLGRVGGGLTDELRAAMWGAPDAYKGRTARVRAQEQFPSGALRAPRLLALHEG